MLNIEKYKDEILKKANEKRKPMCFVGHLREDECCNKYKNCNECCASSIEWLCAEYKEPVKLTLAEKCILESLPKEWKWIARVKNNDLLVCENKPHKYNEVWVGGDVYFFVEIYNHLFQFIKWENEEPCNIEELLAKSEVVEDKKGS